VVMLKNLGDFLHLRKHEDKYIGINMNFRSQSFQLLAIPILKVQIFILRTTHYNMMIIIIMLMAGTEISLELYLPPLHMFSFHPIHKQTHSFDLTLKQSYELS
jgi:hypothetical protein